MISLNRSIFNRSKLKSTAIISSYIILMIFFALVFNFYIDREVLQSIVNNSGWIGIIFYFFIEVIYVTFTPLLNTFIMITSGYIFGGTTGFMINFLATISGLLLIILLVKKYGRPLLQKLVSPKYYNRFDNIIQKVGPITLLIVYILPFTPDDELTYVVAAGPIGLKRFAMPILIGTAAKSAYSYIGDLGAEGVMIALYYRIFFLIVGIICIGLQEYYFLRNKGSIT